VQSTILLIANASHHASVPSDDCPRTDDEPPPIEDGKPDDGAAYPAPVREIGSDRLFDMHRNRSGRLRQAHHGQAFANIVSTAVGRTALG
jgi:hypothetical protein